MISLLESFTAPVPAPAPITSADIERREAELLKLPQVEVPLTHRFAPGVYMREVIMPTGALIIGHEHKTEHLNIISRGRALVMMDGDVSEVVGPCTLLSKPGVRKVLYIREEMQWATIHPTDETDLDKLAALLIVKSESYLQHLADADKLRQLATTDL